MDKTIDRWTDPDGNGYAFKDTVARAQNRATIDKMNAETADRKAEVGIERKRIDNLVKDTTDNVVEYKADNFLMSCKSDAQASTTETALNVFKNISSKSENLGNFITISSNSKIQIKKSGLYSFDCKVQVTGVNASTGRQYARLKINDVQKNEYMISLIGETDEEFTNFIVSLNEGDTISFTGESDFDDTWITLYTTIHILDYDGKVKIPDITKEVSDIRVGEDGTVYGTAGEAVRKQIGNLTEDLKIKDYENGVITDCEKLAYINGEWIETSNRYVGKYFSHVFKNMSVQTSTNKLVYSVYFFDKNFNYIDNTEFSKKNTIPEIPDGSVYFKFGVSTIDASDIGESSIAIMKQFRIAEKFKRPFLNFGTNPISGYYRGLQSVYDYDITKSSASVLTDYSNLCNNLQGYATEENLGKGSDGKPMYSYTFSPIQSNMNKRDIPHILIVCGQHGFEKASVFGLYYFLKDLVENWDKSNVLSYIRHHVKLSIIPIANRYGFDNNIYENANNVNLNRNYPSNWKSSITNAGNSPLDQPETKIISDWLISNKDALFLIDFHTNGQEILKDWTNVNWMTITNDDSDYYNRLYEILGYHLSNITGYFKKDYHLSVQYDTLLGRITKDIVGPYLDAYGVTMGIMSITCEGFPAFVGGNKIFDGNSMKANSEIIGNVIISMINGYFNS